MADLSPPSTQLVEVHINSTAILTCKAPIRKGLFSFAYQTSHVKNYTRLMSYYMSHMPISYE